MTFISALLLLTKSVGTYLYPALAQYLSFVFCVVVVLRGCGLNFCEEFLVQFASLYAFTGFFASLKVYSYDCYFVHHFELFVT